MYQCTHYLREPRPNVLHHHSREVRPLVNIEISLQLPPSHIDDTGHHLQTHRHTICWATPLLKHSIKYSLWLSTCKLLAVLLMILGGDAPVSPSARRAVAVVEDRRCSYLCTNVSFRSGWLKPPPFWYCLSHACAKKLPSWAWSRVYGMDGVLNGSPILARHSYMLQR